MRKGKILTGKGKDAMRMERENLGTLKVRCETRPEITDKEIINGEKEGKDWMKMVTTMIRSSKFIKRASIKNN